MPRKAEDERRSGADVLPGNHPVTAGHLRADASCRILAIDNVDYELEAARDAMRAISVDQMPREGAIEIETGEIKLGQPEPATTLSKTSGWPRKWRQAGGFTGYELD